MVVWCNVKVWNERWALGLEYKLNRNQMPKIVVFRTPSLRRQIDTSGYVGASLHYFILPLSYGQIVFPYLPPSSFSFFMVSLVLVIIDNYEIKRKK